MNATSSFYHVVNDPSDLIWALRREELFGEEKYYDIFIVEENVDDPQWSPMFNGQTKSLEPSRLHQCRGICTQAQRTL